MLKINTYSIKGVKTGEFLLPKEFGDVVNESLLAQAIRVYEERSHVGLRNTKTRSEINRTGKKVYAQKGTGGARHGSRRSNVFVGGGVIFGPRPLRRVLELPTKLKVLAKNTALIAKIIAREVVVVEDLSKVNKTKMAGEFIKKISADFKSKKFTFITSETGKSVNQFLRNLKNTNNVNFQEASALDIFKGGTIILDQNIFEVAKPVKVVKKVIKKTK
ncbi:MAG TPA: 50S ribosomal protein L4 [Alphaproteobacteria bacterium]|jgi:large subunit ribosomal protein L4|nr:50S ribosomal protein L4 [Alphaproteobacteria bacterium]